MNISQQLIAEDTALQFVIAMAKKMLAVDKVILFGSRARQDHRPNSDYDLAFDAPNANFEQWAQFTHCIHNEAPTLCEFDLIHLSQKLAPSILETIKREGVVVYVNQTATGN